MPAAVVKAPNLSELVPAPGTDKVPLKTEFPFPNIENNELPPLLTIVKSKSLLPKLCLPVPLFFAPSNLNAGVVAEGVVEPITLSN